MTCTQLSLFNTAAAAPETTYKVGDFVKLKRKTPHAACFKKGDIIQIEAIHPLDGSCKFWNERTESWGYVYPDDFTLVPPPKINSVSPVSTFVDTEYTVETADTEYTAETADTEYTAETADTEYTAETADTEYTAETADTEYTAETADTEYTAETADTEYTAETADTEYTAETADIDSVSKAISTYRPRGTARSGEYFRFSYRDGSRMRHIHIRGGNTDSPVAIAKVEEVRSLLAAGVPPNKIIEFLGITTKA